MAQDLLAAAPTLDQKPSQSGMTALGLGLAGFAIPYLGCIPVAMAVHDALRARKEHESGRQIVGGPRAIRAGFGLGVGILAIYVALTILVVVVRVKGA